jgi:DNA-binding protein HU-beta
MPAQMSKSQLIDKIATTTELAKRDVKHVMDTLTDVGHKELKKNGIFLVPGFAKFVVVKKPATKARKGTNPFTGEEMMFPLPAAASGPSPTGCAGVSGCRSSRQRRQHALVCCRYLVARAHVAMPSSFATSTRAGATTSDLHQRGFVTGFRPSAASQPRNPRTSLTKRAQAGSRGSST